MKTITVIKRLPGGQESWRYTATLLEESGGRLLLEAPFNAPDTPFMGILIRTGDRFVETYFTDRWYNIFEIHAVEDDRLRGWYCNIATPFQLDGDTLFYVDLALDLLVYPDRRQRILDEDEFTDLEISDQQRQQALTALQDLKNYFKR